MTTDDIDTLEGAPDEICASCGHAESAHIQRDHELAGRTVRRIYCEMCDDEHDFLPSPE